MVNASHHCGNSKVILIRAPASQTLPHSIFQSNLLRTMPEYIQLKWYDTDRNCFRYYYQAVIKRKHYLLRFFIWLLLPKISSK